MRFCLLGPIHPIRGGVSQYTMLLYDALRQEHEVSLISYKRQYPSFLYPGQSQYADDSGREGPPAEWLFDCMSPLSWRRIVRRVQQLEPDCFLYNWVTLFHAVPFGLILRGLRSLPDTRTIAICHNARQHESMPLERSLTRFALAPADRLLVHSAEDERALRELGLTGPITRAFLPSFGSISDSALGTDEARARLDMNGEPLLLFFGYVRAYKGLRYLLSAMPAIRAALPGARLLVVGEFWDDKQPYLEQIRDLGIGDAVTLIDQYVPDADIPTYFAAADLCVLPYVSASQSGIVQLAYGAGTPVVTTNVGGLPDVVTDGVGGLLVPPESPEAIADAVVRACSGGNLASLAAGARQEAERFSWEKLCAMIVELAAS